MTEILNDDVLLEIVSHLDVDDLSKLSTTSQKFRNFIKYNKYSIISTFHKTKVKTNSHIYFTIKSKDILIYPLLRYIFEIFDPFNNMLKLPFLDQESYVFFIYDGDLLKINNFDYPVGTFQLKFMTLDFDISYIGFITGTFILDTYNLYPMLNDFYYRQNYKLIISTLDDLKVQNLKLLISDPSIDISNIPNLFNFINTLDTYFPTIQKNQVEQYLLKFENDIPLFIVDLLPSEYTYTVFNYSNYDRSGFILNFLTLDFPLDLHPNNFINTINRLTTFVPKEIFYPENDCILFYVSEYEPENYDVSDDKFDFKHSYLNVRQQISINNFTFNGPFYLNRLKCYSNSEVSEYVVYKNFLLKSSVEGKIQYNNKIISYRKMFIMDPRKREELLPGTNEASYLGEIQTKENSDFLGLDIIPEYGQSLLNINDIIQIYYYPNGGISKIKDKNKDEYIYSSDGTLYQYSGNKYPGNKYPKPHEYPSQISNLNFVSSPPRFSEEINPDDLPPSKIFTTIHKNSQENKL